MVSTSTLCMKAKDNTPTRYDPAEPLERSPGPRGKARWSLQAACPCVALEPPTCTSGGCGCGVPTWCCCLPGRQEAGAWRSMVDSDDCEAQGEQHAGGGGGKRGGGGGGRGGGWRRVALWLLPASCFGLRRDKHCDYDE